ncbi:phage antirepressor KilAC domain-containing protein [Faecalibacillus faecis]|uniref:phage antirepressor KilAC domain-containing protein n=1 Tax=Faecalibacillus faecis TaxID=1982628 RepID=UPI003868139C
MVEKNNIQIFTNEEFGEIRTIIVNGEPMFVGKDIASALGYKDTAKAIRVHVDDEDKGVDEMDTPGGRQNIIIINESGLYSLILGSKLESAKKFKRWITSEVLPNIRKYGTYMTEETLEKALLNPDFLISLATELKKEKEQRIKLEKEKELNAPKVNFADSVSDTDDLIYVRDLAKLICQNGCMIGEKRLFSWLRENGYLIKKRGTSYNTPTQKSMSLGLFRVVETTYRLPCGGYKCCQTAKVTGKGQQYFLKKFLNY